MKKVNITKRPLSLSLFGLISLFTFAINVSAQTTGTTTPGVPVTGLAGEATQYALLIGFSLLAIGVGLSYLFIRENMILKKDRGKNIA